MPEQEIEIEVDHCVIPHAGINEIIVIAASRLGYHQLTIPTSDLPRLIAALQEAQRKIEGK